MHRRSLAEKLHETFHRLRQLPHPVRLAISLTISALLIILIWFISNPMRFFSGPTPTRSLERIDQPTQSNDTQTLSSGAPSINKPDIRIANLQTPKVTATSFLIADLESGQVLADKSPQKRLPIASLTKLLTALTAVEKIGLTTPIPLTKRIFADQSPDKPAPTELIILKDALRPLLMESSNESGEMIAEAYSKNTFVSWMNQQATSISMHKSNFADPTGMSARNISTALDLFLLVQHIEQSRPDILEITRTQEAHVVTSSSAHEVRNINLFQRDPRFLGGKTGFTLEARETMTAIFTLHIQKEPRKIALIVLGSKDRAQDIGKLLYWLEKATQNQ